MFVLVAAELAIDVVVVGALAALALVVELVTVSGGYACSGCCGCSGAVGMVRHCPLGAFVVFTQKSRAALVWAARICMHGRLASSRKRLHAKPAGAHTKGAQIIAILHTNYPPWRP